VAELNAEGGPDLALTAICADVRVASPTREGQVTEALALLSYRMGRYGVKLEEFNALDYRVGALGEHEFELVFEMRGGVRRVLCVEHRG
jgi:hypothetical protein